ncbi:MAG: alpha/beta fold hydrolase [Rhodospirillales bacterium]
MLQSTLQHNRRLSSGLETLRLVMESDDVSFIFLHGFLGRAETRIAGHTFEYFRGLNAVVAEAGVDAYAPQMPLKTGIEDRALNVRPLLSTLTTPHIVLVGVSMGGLVARALASRHDPACRVRSVVTIATPHRGSPLADRMLAGDSWLPGFLVDQFRPALHDLTLAEAKTFNARTPDRPDVSYHSWAFARDDAEMPPLFKKRQQRIFALEGPNDGLVSVHSATWGKFMGTERADHLECIGWSPAFANKDIGRPYNQMALWRRVIETGLGCVGKFKPYPP